MDDTHHHTTPTTGPSASDMSAAVPRGNVFRNTEPVVAPVAAPVATHTGPLDANERRVIDEPPVRTRETTRVSGHPQRRRFSIGATFLGWAVASFFSILFTLVVLALVGGAGADAANDANGLTNGDLTSLGTTALIGTLVAMFLAYLIGGYAAGRIGHWAGAKHGALVPVWSILFALLLFGVGSYLGDAFNVGLAYAVPANVDWNAVGTYGALSLVAMLVADFLGAILGGILGAKGDQRYEGDHGARLAERTRGYRGRPL